MQHHHLRDVMTTTTARATNTIAPSPDHGASSARYMSFRVSCSPLTALSSLAHACMPHRARCNGARAASKNARGTIKYNGGRPACKRLGTSLSPSRRSRRLLRLCYALRWLMGKSCPHGIDRWAAHRGYRRSPCRRRGCQRDQSAGGGQLRGARARPEIIGGSRRIDDIEIA